MVPSSAIAELRSQGWVEAVASEGIPDNHYAWQPGSSVRDQREALLSSLPEGKLKETLTRRWMSAATENATVAAAAGAFAIATASDAKADGSQAREHHDVCDLQDIWQACETGMRTEDKHKFVAAIEWLRKPPGREDLHKVCRSFGVQQTYKDGKGSRQRRTQPQLLKALNQCVREELKRILAASASSPLQPSSVRSGIVDMSDNQKNEKLTESASNIARGVDSRPDSCDDQRLVEPSDERNCDQDVCDLSCVLQEHEGGMRAEDKASFVAALAWLRNPSGNRTLLQICRAVHVQQTYTDAAGQRQRRTQPELVKMLKQTLRHELGQLPVVARSCLVHKFVFSALAHVCTRSMAGKQKDLVLDAAECINLGAGSCDGARLRQVCSDWNVTFTCKAADGRKQRKTQEQLQNDLQFAVQHHLDGCVWQSNPGNESPMTDVQQGRVLAMLESLSTALSTEEFHQMCSAVNLEATYQDADGHKRRKRHQDLLQSMQDAIRKRPVSGGASGARQLIAYFPVRSEGLPAENQDAEDFVSQRRECVLAYRWLVDNESQCTDLQDASEVAGLKRELWMAMLSDFPNKCLKKRVCCLAFQMCHSYQDHNRVWQADAHQ